MQVRITARNRRSHFRLPFRRGIARRLLHPVDNLTFELFLDSQRGNILSYFDVEERFTSFSALATVLVPYNVADLLATVGALQLLPPNASRVTRVEALAHTTASLRPGPTALISTGKLRAICAHEALQDLAHYEDPAENQFAEEFTFFGGSYLVIRGIAQSAEYMLSNLCKAIFLDPNETLPREMRARGFQVVSSALHTINAVVVKAGIPRGTPPASDRYKPIYIPHRTTLKKLKESVSFGREEFTSFLNSKKLPPNALDALICRGGEINLEDYSVENGPVLWKPFVECEGRIILAIPGMVISAIRQELLRLAAEIDVRAELADLYRKAVWQDVVQSFSYTRNIPLSGPTLSPLRVQSSSEGFFSLDRDKVLYCLLVTDPLTRRIDSDPFGIWTSDALGKSVNDRIAEIESSVFSAVPAPNDVLIVVAFQGLGGAAIWGLGETPCDSHSIPLSAEALRTISLVEGGDPLALFNFARARDNARKRTKITTTNILDEFCLFRKNEYSFYFSDQAFDIVWIPPGDSLHLQLEVARQRDFHASTTIDGAAVEVTSLHSSASIPIYSSVADLGEHVRLVVEGLPVPVWITGPEESSNNEEHQHYALFADAVSFWIWQFTPFLVGPLSFLLSKRPLEIRLNLPANEAWRNQSERKAVQGGRPVEVTTKPTENCVEVEVNAELLRLMQRADNIGERELMRAIIEAL